MEIYSPTNSTVQRELLKISEVAFMLGISQSSVRRLIDRGILKANRNLRHLLISQKALQGFINS